MFLSKEIFSTVVENTPLISMDLIVQNSEGKVLLGKRVNEPACGFWFVPGGRIFKDESLDSAFVRTVKDELALEMKRTDAVLYGLYEHFYENNVFNNNFRTHYIVLAHKLILNNLPALNKQHSQYKWFNVKDLLEDETVHKYTKDYFR